MKTIDIIFCALGMYALGFFIASLLWWIFRLAAGRPSTEMWWKRLYIISCTSWVGVVCFLLIGLEILVLGAGMVIEERVKGKTSEDVNQKVKEM